MGNEHLMARGDFNLESLKVMHMLHTLDVDVAKEATTVRLGFRWAEIGEGQGLFLCVCSAPCADPEICGRTFFASVQEENPARVSTGHEVEVLMPWKKDSEEIRLDVWCCDNCRVEGTGAIFDTWVGRFHDVPARLLQWEHEERSRSYAGLRDSMRKAYPDSFHEGSYVTVVLYRRTT